MGVKFPEANVRFFCIRCKDRVVNLDPLGIGVDVASWDIFIPSVGLFGPRGRDFSFLLIWNFRGLRALELTNHGAYTEVPLHM